ncbi:Transposase [Cordylochernes scorpioides]|uniref:Transposase n=1 Tax=Cordylochernes scorpioides TaxID=51811 RepID=A0ABY6L9V5_9ARAC|nr:Transposase [Cordylochernes scorpioides]
MTSVIQPMDKGVIKNLKHFYRRFLVENILTGDSEALKIKLGVLQASRLCKKAWDQLTSETIKHCFKKAGFVKKEEDEENADDIIAETMPSVDGWEDVISNPTISYDDFLNVDAVCGEITDADIIAEVLNHNIEKQDGDEASGDEDESSVAGEMNVPSAAEATNYIMHLRRFFESKNDRMPDHRKRRQFKQTDAFTRGMVIGLKRAGWSIRQIAADTHLGASTVHRLWRRWLEQGNVAIYRNAGATRVTSARVDRRILRQAVAGPQATCTAILQHVQDTLDHSISTRTISRRLVANGLHSCRPLKRLPLTPPNRRQRLEWCRARSTWMTEWHRVVFSDESRFCLSSDSRRVRVWRRRGERSNPAAIVERPTVRQRGIMVWGAIAYDSRSPLLRIQGTMTAQRYVDDVLRPVTLPYLQGVPNALYQQPPYSPDLSPIEHVWDIIGRRLHALPQPRSEDELWQMVEREWRAIPQDAIRTLIDSLPRRVAACIAVRGGPTCY